MPNAPHHSADELRPQGLYRGIASEADYSSDWPGAQCKHHSADDEDAHA